MIRVFSLPSGEKLFNFTRGISGATMYSLNFSNDSSYLLCSSDTGTIHVFQLEDATKQETKGNNSIVDENRLVRAHQSAPASGSKWFSFLVPKTCEEMMSG